MNQFTRREFLRRVTLAGATAYLIGGASLRSIFGANDPSPVFQITDIPKHDGALRHEGMDVLLDLLAHRGLPLYQSGADARWSGANGLIHKDDVVLIKVNAQWKCRGATNTDVVRGLIHRILQHPDGFDGEVVIFENGQGQGGFNGDPRAWGRYEDHPEVAGVVVNSEHQQLTVDKLVHSVFADAPVSSYLLDPIRETFIAGDNHKRDGYRKRNTQRVSYPCFTTAGGHRIELREGIWNGSGYGQNLKLINIPVLKTHDGTGITGVLKHSYGILSMADGWGGNVRHYKEAGTQCGKMYSIVRPPALNIVDCIWVTYDHHHMGYPPGSTERMNMLLAGPDPVALDYHGSKHILYPLGGEQDQWHDPDNYAGLINHLTGAQQLLNDQGGIRGTPTKQGDEHLQVFSGTG